MNRNRNQHLIQHLYPRDSPAQPSPAQPPPQSRLPQVGEPETQLSPKQPASRLAVIIGHDAGLALARAAAPSGVRDVARHRVAAVEGVVDLAAVGGVGRGLELGVGVSC